MKIKLLYPSGDWTGPPKIEYALNPHGFAWDLSQATHVVRWGYVGKFPNGLNQQARVLNKKAAIMRASCKSGARRTLQDMGIRVPLTVFGIESYLRSPGLFKDYTVIIRPAKHAGGFDYYESSDPFEVYARMASFWPGGYIQRKIESVAEYRVVVFQGRVLFAYEKKAFLQTNPGQHGIDTDISMIPWGDYGEPMCRPAIEAVSALGLDFGAVDILLGEAGEFYVLEVNTAPECGTTYRAEKFAKAITYWADGRTPQPVDYLDWKSILHPSEQE